jgi:hypothetical protein
MALLKRGAWCLGLGLGAAALFWVPALLGRNLVQTNRLITGLFAYQDHFVFLYQLVVSKWGYDGSYRGQADGMSFELGYFQWLCLVGVLWQGKRMAAASSKAWPAILFFAVLLAAAAFFSCAESIFIWDRVRLLQYFQFPWRFLSLATLSMAFVCGAPFLMIKKTQGKIATALMLICLAALFYQSYAHARPSDYTDARDEDATPQKIASQNISVNSFNEYETIWMKQAPKAYSPEKAALVSGSGQISQLTVGPIFVHFQVSADNSARVRINTAYFPGWVLRVDGQPVPILYNNPQGAVEFELAQGVHQVSLQFEDTPIVLACTAISILSLILLAFYPRLPRVLSGKPA